MRLVIEVTESERSAIKVLQDLYNTTYSALVRALVRLTVDGTVPHAKLREALAPAPRPVLNVTLVSGPGTDLAKHKHKFTPGSWEANLSEGKPGIHVQSDKDRTERPTRRVRKK